MKLIKMHVDNFGCLHNFDYEFKDGLNVILHDNGWGKTTMASFLKAMLYGFDTKRSRDITENERKRYSPWQGGKYGGSLDFEAEGKKFRIFRTFGQTPRYDKATLMVLGSNAEIKIDADKIGEMLFRLDASAFQRSVYINQNGLSIDGAASSIHTRLNALVSQANDVAAFDDAIARLTAQVKVYEKTGSRGLLGDTTRQIAANEREKEKLEKEIAEQDQARERISELDAQLIAIAEIIRDKKEKLEKVTGEAQKREAARRLLEDLNKQIAGVEAQLAEIADSLGGKVPDDAEIDQVKLQSQSAAALTKQLDDLTLSYKKLLTDYELLQQKYNGQLPTADQLDEIQNIYGELQGIRSTENEAAPEDEPEGYTMIRDTAATDAEFIDRLTITVSSQMTLQQYIRKLEEADRDVSGEQRSWTEKKKRFAGYAAEVSRFQTELEDINGYAPESVDPVIDGLDNLQRKQRALGQQAADQKASIGRERSSWAEKKRRHKSFEEETVRLRGAVDALSVYRPEAVDPVISGLETQQEKQRILSQQIIDQNASVTRETESWAEKKRRFNKLSSETERIQGECDALQTYRPEAVDPVLSALETQQKKQQILIQQEANQTAAVKREKEGWNEKKKKYSSLKEEADRLEEEVQSRSRYETSFVSPSIESLKEIQKQQQLVDLRQEELVSDSLTADQETLLAKYPGELPDVSEANAVLKKLRSNTQKKSDVQGVSAKLSGEQARVNSLKESVDQIGNVEEDTPVEEPKKSSGTVMIGAGAAIAAIGAVLIFVISPFMAAMAAIGAFLIVAGAAANSSYRKKQQAYENYRASSAKKQESRKKKTELQEQLDAALSSVAALQKQIDELNASIEADEADIDTWSKKWADGSELTEGSISEIIENTEQAARLRKKKQEIAAKEEFVVEKTAFITEERKKVDDQYPELNGLSIEAALEQLRSAETEAKLYNGQLQTAGKNLEKFLTEAKLSADQIAAEESPALTDMQAKLSEIRSELAEIEAGRKALDEHYPEISGMSYDNALRTLRAKENEYRLVFGQLQTARKNLENFFAETGLSADQFNTEESPAAASMHEKLSQLQVEQEELDSNRRAFDENYPEISGLNYDEALKILRTKAGEYKMAASQLQTAIQNEAKSAADAKVDAVQLKAEESPLIAGMQAELDRTNEELRQVTLSRTQYDQAFPEIEGMVIEDAKKFLRGKESSYRIINGQRQTAQRNLQKYLADTKLTEGQLASDESPKLAELTAARESASQTLTQALNDVNEVLAALDLDTDAEHILQALREAEQILNEYKQYAGKLQERAERQEKKQRKINELQDRLDEKLVVLQNNYEDAEISARLQMVRKDIGNAARMKEKNDENEHARQILQEKVDAAGSEVDAFIAKYVYFEPQSEDILSEVDAKVGKYAELTAAKAELEKQRSAAGQQNSASAIQSEGGEEAELREQIRYQESRRDAFLVEYTQKSDFIRQADKSLEKYPDILAETSQLYDQKQRAQNTLFMLKRTIQLITRAKENLANRYLGKVERLFNSYLQIWLQNDAIHGILDIDFRISMEDNQKVHLAEGYSTGYCDLIDLCMRLALVDTLFESEAPFLILDDPFVNLDEDRLNKSMDLLQLIASDKQIIYFVCHPVRSEAKGLSNIAGKSYAELMRKARKVGSESNSAGDTATAGSQRTGRKKYHFVPAAHTALIRPVNPDYIITANIFDLSIEVVDDLLARDAAYEIFFIDEKGHVLNDRLNVEVVNGKLSTSKLRFCLNVRAGSGDCYELIVRKADQPEYEILGRTAFKSMISSFGTLESRKSFFMQKFRKSDILDITPYLQQYGTEAIQTALKSMEENLDILEFEENQYINIRKLEKAGVNKTQLQAYGDEVCKAASQMKFFTVRLLKQEGFTSELDELGFGDVFYEFLLSQDKRFAKLSVGKTAVFSSTVKKFNTVDFLTEYMTQVSVTDVNSLLDDLERKYGITMTRSGLLTHIKNSTLYYDKILDYVYKDYETYYQDI